MATAAHRTPDAYARPDTEHRLETPAERLSFLPRRHPPRGPYRYTFKLQPARRRSAQSERHRQFYATDSRGQDARRDARSNPTMQAATLRCDVNNAEGKTVTIPIKATLMLDTPIPNGATEVGVRYSGGRELVILETSFR
jgi:hypothetical protein